MKIEPAKVVIFLRKTKKTNKKCSSVNKSQLIMKN